MSEQFTDKQIAIAYDYWQEIRGMRVAPRREELNLRAMSSLLPHFNLLDVTWNPLQFRHRLVGATYVEMMGRNVTGHFVDEEIYGKAANEIFETLKLVAEEIRPYRRLARLDWHDRNWLLQEAAELPLVDEDGHVNMILRVSVFTPTTDLDSPRLSFVPLTQTISV